MRHGWTADDLFSKRTLGALGRRGITLIGLTTLPGEGSLPFANGEKAYVVDDNGIHRVWTFQQVLDASKCSIVRP